jgi:hypothetical protein
MQTILIVCANSQSSIYPTVITRSAWDQTSDLMARYIDHFANEVVLLLTPQHKALEGPW